MNRRRFSRKVYLGNVLVSPLPRESWFAANAINIGQGGVQLYSHRFLEPGRLVKMLIRSGIASSTTLIGRVTNFRVDAEGTCLGIAFACPLSPTERRNLFEELGVRISL